ncbi:MAG: DUF2628 domain-containing protein, partial [Bauldia sp.]
MAIYTVLAPAARDGEAASDPMKTVFVKDGYSWPALFFAVVWMIYRRMWLMLVLYVAVGLAAGFIAQRAGGDVAGFALVIAHVLFALEANNLRRWTLERRGFRLVGVAEGRNIEEAEIGYFAGLEAGEPAVVPLPTPPTPPTSPAPPTTRPTPPTPSTPGVLYRPDPVRPSAEAG